MEGGVAAHDPCSTDALNRQVMRPPISAANIALQARARL